MSEQTAGRFGLGEPGSGVVEVDTGPGVVAIGEVAGLRVLDLGSGLDRNAARPALGAEVTAVDASQAQHRRALARYPGTPGLRLVCADAVAHLQEAAPYDRIYSVDDLIYSVGGVPYVDPRRLLPAVAHGLAPEGHLVFSANHTNSYGVGPSTAVPRGPRLSGCPVATNTTPWACGPSSPSS